MRSLLRLLVLGLCIAGLVFGAVGARPALALTSDQDLVAEVWRIVNRAYVDETFNHQNWWFIRQRALKRTLATREDAYDAIREMLAHLDDPYTRLLPPDQYHSLQTNTAGALTGVGLQITKDDDPAVLSLVCSVLTNIGYDVCSARNGNRGIEKFKKENPTLVITDIHMPDISGIDVLRI